MTPRNHTGGGAKRVSRSSERWRPSTNSSGSERKKMTTPRQPSGCAGLESLLDTWIGRKLWGRSPASTIFHPHFALSGVLLKQEIEKGKNQDGKGEVCGGGIVPQAFLRRLTCEEVRVKRPGHSGGFSCNALDAGRRTDCASSYFLYWSTWIQMHESSSESEKVPTPGMRICGEEILKDS